MRALRACPGVPLALLALLASAVAHAAPAPVPPDEGTCPTVSGAAPRADGAAARDAEPVTLREGMRLGFADLLVLQRLVPREIWQHRDVFFHEGMQMELGPCHRHYPVPAFFTQATRTFSRHVELDRKGNLRGYVAGLPFAPEEIDLEREDAALRWAWDMQQRYRGAGHRGSFRIVDFPNRYGGIEVFAGNFYLLPTSARADLAERDHRLEAGERYLWVAGGRFTQPTSARHLAWRQFRPRSSLRDPDQPDTTFVYVPSMRKSRRASTSWVDGIYVPAYSVSDSEGGGAVSFGGEMGGSINPASGRQAATTSNAYAGFEGLVLRPNAYVWRTHGSREVLAPINATRTGYPLSPDRNFGPSGLSVASDRWEIRQAVVIEGALRRQGESLRTVTYYVDQQTQLPLYRITRTGNRRIIDIQIFVHRFSGDVHDYPDWPGGTPAFVFDPVAEVSYNAIGGGGGWRRESYDIVSTPFDPDDLPGLTSAAALERGH